MKKLIVVKVLENKNYAYLKETVTNGILSNSILYLAEVDVKAKLKKGQEVKLAAGTYDIGEFVTADGIAIKTLKAKV